MTVGFKVDMTQGEQVVSGLTTRMLSALSNLTVVWHTVGLKVQEHIAERWTNDYAQFAPLSVSTQLAKARALERRGYNDAAAKARARAKREAARLDRIGEDAAAHSVRLGLSGLGGKSLAGYYQTKKPGTAPYLRRGDALSFWWTGKALGKALGEDAFDAGHRTLRISFGRQSEARRNLERMHFGGKTRPARPVYDIDKVAAIAQEWMDKFVEATLKASTVGTFAVRRA